MHRISAALFFATMLAPAALASSGSDLKAGYAAVLRHQYDQAIARLTAAIDAGVLNPRDQALAYQWRGAEYLHKGEDELAILDFNRALDLDPTLATAYSDRGVAHRRQGRYEFAIADYTEAIRLWPNWHDWYLNRGLAYQALGRHDEAIADFTKAVFYAPGLAKGYLLRADAEAEKNNLREAAADIRRATRIDANAFAGFPMLAEKFRKLGLLA
jgi:tetratricopeptide (TPR) repeat protein